MAFLQPFEKIFRWDTVEQGLELLQDKIQEFVEPLLQDPMNSNVLIEGVELDVGSNSIPHLLDRSLIGYFIVRQNAASDITIDEDLTDNRFLVLDSTAICTVSIIVF